MKKLKIMTVVGTRPEIIRLSRVIAALENSEAVSHVLVHTGQNYDYELNQIFFEDLEMRKPDYFLEAAGKNAAETIGQSISRIDPVLEEVMPDAFLVLGDTNSCLCAIPAKKRKVPVFHMEAGNRCFDQRVPEETNRRIVDHISDINLTYSDIAREYLLREGLPPDRIIKTGSPMFEVLMHNRERIEGSDVMRRLKLIENSFFLVSSHREENVSDPVNFRRFLGLLENLARVYKYPVIVSTHPRTAHSINAAGIKMDPLINLLKPLGFLDYVHLQQKAFAVLSDSGTISEESSILNFPALNLREAHERPEAMEEASVPLVGYNVERVQQSIAVIKHQTRGKDRELRLVSDYSMPNVSEKVLRIILSYTDYVNRVVWNKHLEQS
jgi:UDP-N-acetylglucosamine 2-epimerase (non-hydrolysing)